MRTLRWKTVPGATYYEVRLRRNGTTVLELWPTAASAVLPTNWRDHGAENGLVPGRYSWFVYPGFGTKVSGQYGSIVGSGVFVVTKSRGDQ